MLCECQGHFGGIFVITNHCHCVMRVGEIIMKPYSFLWSCCVCMPSNTVHNRQCLFACFKYCTESAVLVCMLQTAPDTVQNRQCLFACFKLLQILYRIGSVCLHASSYFRYCTESAVFVACFNLPPNTVQNKYCTESRVFACFKLLQILYRTCVCMLQAVQNLQCLFACFMQPPDTVQNLQCLFACFMQPPDTVQNLQCLFACFMLPPDTVQNLQCLFACFKLLQMLYRICVCMLQAAPDTVQNPQWSHASSCLQILYGMCSPVSSALPRSYSPIFTFASEQQGLCHI